VRVVRISSRPKPQLDCSLNDIDVKWVFCPILIGDSQLSVRAIRLHCLSLMPHSHHWTDVTGSSVEIVRSRLLPECRLALSIGNMA
jgi:hypothetical protein